MPLVVVDPRGRRVGEGTSYFASTHDLGPTILAMADVRRAPTMSGVDLSRVFERRSPPTRGYAYGGYSNSHFLRSERWAYMSDNSLESPQLFDLNHDPGELTNVAARHPDVVAELADTVLRQAGDPLPFYKS